MAKFGQASCRAGSIPDLSAVRLDADPIIDRVMKALLTAKIFLGRLDRDVTEKELDLVQFASGIVTQTGTGPTKVVWGEVLNGCSLGAVLHDMPHYPFRYTTSPNLACAANTPK